MYSGFSAPVKPLETEVRMNFSELPTACKKKMLARLKEEHKRGIPLTRDQLDFIHMETTEVLRKSFFLGFCCSHFLHVPCSTKIRTK